MISINRKAVRASGGTQSDELKAKIKSVTSSITVGAVFVYDTSQDSDGGAWRKKTQGLSWYDEASSATRSSRKEFPSMALIVADNATPATVTIYDLDDPAMPMWMVFNAYSPAWETNAAFVSTNSVLSIFALNARMYVGGGNGLIEIDFTTEQQTNFRPISSTQRIRHKKSGAIVDRNDTSGQFRITATPIVNEVGNDVAATVLEGAEIGALGLPIPTVAVATNGGVSVIHPSGDVFDQTKTISSTVNSYDVAFGENGDLFWSSRAISSKGTYVLWLRNTLYADSTATPDALYYPTGIVGGNDVQYLGASSPYCNDFKVTKNGLAIGSTHGLSLIKHNEGNPNDGAVAYVTSTYNTGYMLGDIKGAWLTGGDASTTGRYDRSVGNTDLVENGTVLHAAAETDAEVTKYYDFSASNYFSQANNTDFDFGTGDFSISLWVKNTNWTGSQRLLGRSQDSNTKRLSIYASGTTLYAYIKDGSAKSASADVLQNNVWQHVFAFRRGSVLYLFIDGKLVNSVAGADTVNITPASNGMLVIGSETFDNGSTIESTALVNGSLSLVRISATAPTPQQVKDIYEAEKPLFRSGAKCLLQSDHPSLPNTVLNLAHDKSTDLLSVSQYAQISGNGISVFRGLEMVDTFKGSAYGWDVNSTALVATSGGVSTYGRTSGTGGVIVDLPAIDVRAELNGSESKLPDDGKLHFSGVTTDATVTMIGEIPVAEGESYMVRGVISGNQYQDQDGERILVTMERTFYRDIGGNILARSDTMKMTDETTSSMDALLSYNTSPPAHNIRIKVTGKAGTRMQWNASVDVQRVTEKTYER